MQPNSEARKKASSNPNWNIRVSSGSAFSSGNLGEPFNQFQTWVKIVFANESSQMMTTISRAGQWKAW